MRWSISTVALSVSIIALPGAAVELSDAIRDEYRIPAEIPFPENAPYSPMVATLGKMLYFDPRLSGAQNMSCASCHNPSFGWETPVDLAVGGMNVPLPRHAPTILNMAWLDEYFWDGRAGTLEEQAAGPITAPAEMNATMDEVVDRLTEVDGYRTAFDRAFPGTGLTGDNVLTAIATFERTVVSGWSPFDRWIAGEEDAISAPAKRGFALFTGEARCAECHTGWNFSDNDFHDIGLSSEDAGRAAITGDIADSHAFKTPGLRNIALRAPYMNDGSLDDLESVILHYAGGGIDRPSLSPLIGPLDLSDREVADLIAFMDTLTGEEEETPTPILPAN